MGTNGLVPDAALCGYDAHLMGNLGRTLEARRDAEAPS